jgi:hypothetical protein
VDAGAISARASPTHALAASLRADAIDTSRIPGGRRMTAHHPDDLDRLFADALNAGDLDALVALYEPDASLTPTPGKTVAGKRPSASRWHRSSQ